MMPDFAEEMAKVLAAGTGGLTEDQRKDILEIVREAVYDDACSSGEYLRGIIEEYVAKLDYETAVRVAECEEEYWSDRFPFHPLTGEPWPEGEDD